MLCSFEWITTFVIYVLVSCTRHSSLLEFLHDEIFREGVKSTSRSLPKIFHFVMLNSAWEKKLKMWNGEVRNVHFCYGKGMWNRHKLLATSFELFLVVDSLFISILNHNFHQRTNYVKWRSFLFISYICKPIWNFLFFSILPSIRGKDTKPRNSSTFKRDMENLFMWSLACIYAWLPFFLTGS